MDKKLSAKFAALQGLPTGLARQMAPSEIRSKASTKFQEAMKAKRQRVGAALAAASEKTGAFKSTEPAAGDSLTAAQKVKAWRLANPEAYEKQKREFAEKRAAKKRAEREKT